MPFFFLSKLNDERNLPAFFDVLLAKHHALQTPEKKERFKQDLLDWNTKNNGTLLELAVKFNHVNFLVAFMAMGYHHNYFGPMLLWAAQYGRIDIIKRLIATYGALSEPCHSYDTYHTFLKKLHWSAVKSHQYDVTDLCTHTNLWPLHQSYVNSTALLDLTIPSQRNIDWDFLCSLGQQQLYQFFDRLVKAYNNPALQAKTLFYLQHKKLNSVLHHLAIRSRHQKALSLFPQLPAYIVDYMGNTAAFALDADMLKLLITDYGLTHSPTSWEDIGKKYHGEEDTIKKIGAVKAEYSQLQLQYKSKSFKRYAMHEIRTTTPLHAPGIAELVGEYYILSEEELAELNGKCLMFTLSYTQMHRHVSLANFNALVPMLPLVHQREVSQEQLMPFLQNKISKSLLYDIVSSLDRAHVQVCPQELRPIIARKIEEKRPSPYAMFLLFMGSTLTVAMHVAAIVICCLTLPFLFLAVAPNLLLGALILLPCLYTIFDVVWTVSCIIIMRGNASKQFSCKHEYDLNFIGALNLNLDKLMKSFLDRHDTLWIPLVLNLVNCPLLIIAIVLTFTVALPPVALGVGIGLAATTSFAVVSGVAAAGFFGYKYHQKKPIEQAAIAEIDRVLRAEACTP